MSSSITLDRVYPRISLSCKGADLLLAYTIPILDIDIEQAKRMYDVNVWGVIRTTQVFSSLVIAAEGTIVIIGSVAGIMPYVYGGPIPLFIPVYS
jgi:NAD(P)-dependent dehydrogenase (short-subunit alcohol dehydrogenase family)